MAARGNGVSRIFLSHSSANNAEAVVLYDWLTKEGWKDEIFLDLDPARGIAAGERWERALNEAADRCEAVLFLVSKAWLASRWCLKELNLAHRLNKRLFGVLIEDLPIGDMPPDLAETWQLVRLASGRDHVMLDARLPVTHEEVHVTFSREGLSRLKNGLEQAGLEPKYFIWPPANDPQRPPYRGLLPLEAEDAGIFFGRDAHIIEALGRLRGIRQSAPPRLSVILGASGAGKSSFMRGGLLPRLTRDDRNFLPLPLVRPNRAALTGDGGLLVSLESAFRTANVPVARARLRDAVEGGVEQLRPLLTSLVERCTPPSIDQGATKPPTLILPIDQGEELFAAEGQEEAAAFLKLLNDLLRADAPPLIALFTIRSDSYERLQMANELEGVRQETLSLPPMPKGSYVDIIKGPVRRLANSPRSLDVEDGLVNALLLEIEQGGAKDSLPLLAFTLERLYLEYGGARRLQLADYEKLGRISGSIEAAVEQALKAADADADIPKDRATRLELLRRGIIPWLATVDPETGEPRRRVALMSEIPADSRRLISHFVEQRLLATDRRQDTNEQTIEPAHEALLRQWKLLRGWLLEDSGLLGILDGVQRASREWVTRSNSTAWLTHARNRLEAAEELGKRPDLANQLTTIDRDYLAACRKAETAAANRKRIARTSIYLLLVGVITGLLGWINQDAIKQQANWWFTMRPYMNAEVRPHVLSGDAERALKPRETFKECAKDCPLMVAIPPGEFDMGTPTGDPNYQRGEGPQHRVTIGKRFAVSKTEVTFADWDACVAVGACPHVSDGGWQRGKNPVINVTWLDAKHYADWFSRMTGKPYRLLTEAEWEYAARAESKTIYSWGNELGTGNANCNGCGTQWDGKQPSPAGSFPPNGFGLHDMLGNVWEWVEDCYHPDYNGAPTDGRAWTTGDCNNRVARGGSWVGLTLAARPRSAYRDWRPLDGRSYGLGFRLARDLE